MDWVHANTGGVPRLINQLCHYALAQARVTERERVDADLLMKVPEDFCGGFALSFDRSLDRQARAQETIAETAGPRRISPLRNQSLRASSIRIPSLRMRFRPAIRPISIAAAVALLVGGAAWWPLHMPHTVAASPAVTIDNNDVAHPDAAAAAAAPDSAAPDAATPAAASVAATTPVQIDRNPDTEQLSATAKTASTPTAAANPTVASHGTWFVNRAIDRLNAGDAAGAERLMSQASAAGARAEDLADLRAGIDAQKLELRLVSAADQIQTNIASGSLLDPAGDNAETHYQDMSAVSANDPLTLRAQRELHAALLSKAHDAVQKEQSDSARRYLAAAEKLGSSPEFAAAQEQLREELNRTTQRAAGVASAAVAAADIGTSPALPQHD
jgi:hypothetical protein